MVPFYHEQSEGADQYKGCQVAPAELKGPLLQNEPVQGAAVMGINMPELGTGVPLAYIVRRGGCSCVERGLCHCHQVA